MEVKYNLPDFGSFELKWDSQKKWHFIDYSKSSEKEKFRLPNVKDFISSGILDKINDVWQEIPNKYTKRKFDEKDMYDDMKRFKETYIPIQNNNAINEYYLNKGCQYICIRNYGFYDLKGNDSLKTGAPKFQPTQVYLKIRVKNRTGRYGFVATLRIKQLQKSPIDLYKEEDLIKALVKRK